MGDVNESGSLDFSFLAFDKYYTLHKGSILKVDRLKRMQIISGYRHWWTKNFSIASGLNSGYTMGDPESLYDSCANTCSDMKTHAHTVTEYAVDLDLTAAFPLNSLDETLFSLKYSYSLSSTGARDSDMIVLQVEIKWALNKPKNLKF